MPVVRFRSGCRLIFRPPTDHEHDDAGLRPNRVTGLAQGKRGDDPGFARHVVHEDGISVPELEEVILRGNLVGSTVRHVLAAQQLREANDRIQREVD